MTGDDADEPDPWNGGGKVAEEEEDEGVVEYFVLQESTGYMAPTLRFLAILHTVISFLCVVGYYYLKVRASGTPARLSWTHTHIHTCIQTFIHVCGEGALRSV